jgi:peptidoglycan hydrolase-like protein with peptidoglycan-binding domain
MKTIHFAKRAVITATCALSLLAIITPSFASAATLTRQLQLGMNGADVSTLQSFLALDNTIYPQGLVTGYFGGLTKSAVSNFQSRNSIPSVGRVGPQTLLVLNAQMVGGGTITGDIDAATISNIGVTRTRVSATIGWVTSEATRGVVYYSASPLVQVEYPNNVTVSGSTAMTDTMYRSFEAVTLSNLQPNTTYHYLIYTTDQAGNVSVTVPSTFTTAQ